MNDPSFEKEAEPSFSQVKIEVGCSQLSEGLLFEMGLTAPTEESKSPCSLCEAMTGEHKNIQKCLRHINNQFRRMNSRVEKLEKKKSGSFGIDNC